MQYTYTMTRKILNAYYPPEEFYVFITYGPLGYGKSTYDFKVGVEVLMRVYHYNESEAWEKLKQFIVFHPTQFFERIDQVEASGYKRVPFIIWEDMGLWLNALEWYDPFIKAFLEYLNLARTHLAALIGSTPSPEWVLRRLRRFPQAYTVKIKKADPHENDPSTNIAWKRIAQGYIFWMHPDLKHTGVRTIWADIFYCKMPEDFFKWYKPIRDTYENMALALLKDKWRELSEKNRSMLLQQYPDILTLPSLTRT